VIALTPRPAGSHLAATGAAVAAAELVVGAVELDAKDLLVLRSLLRLLDRRHGLRLHSQDDPARCNVVFVPAGWPLRLPATCITVQVQPAGQGAGTGGLCLVPPLRASNVLAALQTAAGLLACGQQGAPLSEGLPALFQTLTRHLLARERRSTLLPLADGRTLLLDPGAARVHGLPLAELLDGGYRLQAPQRAADAQAQTLAALPGVGLRELLWAAAQRLGSEGVACSELAGGFRLLRWPDATALAQPGVPRLAALWTQRAMRVDEAAPAARLPLLQVRWFLEAALALGMASPAAHAGEAGERADAAATAPALSPAPVRRLLGRLRERLKLW